MFSLGLYTINQADISFVKVKKALVILFFSVFSLSQTSAQVDRYSSWDIGLSAGGAYYIGDLNPTNHITEFTKAYGSINARYNFNRRFATRASFSMAQLYADDADSKSIYQQNRNLNFRTNIQELSAAIEFNFFNYIIGGKHNDLFSPYAFIGLALFHFNPEGESSEGWEKLKPLNTEGQGLANTDGQDYSRFQISVPFGTGVKLSLSDKIGMGFEWGIRKTFTDYLDDVSTTYFDPRQGSPSSNAALTNELANKSLTPLATNKQRGNPTNKDWYTFMGVFLSFKLVKQKTCPSAY